MSLLGTSCRDARIRPEAGRSRGERESDRHRKWEPGSWRQGAAKTHPHRPPQGGRGIPPITRGPETGLHPAEVPCGPCLQPRRATGRLGNPPPRPALALGCHPQLPRRLKCKPPGSSPGAGEHGEPCTVSESRPSSRGCSGLGGARLLAPSAVCPLPPQVLFKGHRERMDVSAQGKRKSIRV